MDFSQIQWDIKGKVCLITGGNSGIGRETALQLVKSGAGRVILACRNTESAEETATFIRKEAGITDEAEGNRRIAVKKLDLACLESIRQCSEAIDDEERVLHILINNAGVYAPSELSKTSDGFELSFGINHVGHYLLTKLLIPLLKRSAPSRIIVVSSSAYKLCWPGGFHLDDANYESTFYEAWLAYCQSKLANILFAMTLDEKLNGSGFSGVTVFSVAPNSSRTNLIPRNRGRLMKLIAATLWNLFSSTPADGAATTLSCATTPGIEQYSGQYFTNGQVAETWAIAHDPVVGEQLWELTEKLIEGKY